MKIYLAALVAGAIGDIVFTIVWDRLSKVRKARAERARLYAQHPSPLTRAGLEEAFDRIGRYQVAGTRAWIRRGPLWQEMCWKSQAPVGWLCSRDIGHEGPCAAWPCH